MYHRHPPLAKTMQDRTSAVGEQMRYIPPVAPEDSIGRAAELLRYAGSGAIPVVSYGYPVGLMDEEALRAAIEAGLPPDAAVQAAMKADVPVLRVDHAIAEAYEALSETHEAAVLVVDANGLYMGLLSAADLYARDRQPVRPHVIGGMATPLGVYLTTGSVEAGARWPALMMTGALMFSAYILANLAVAGLALLVQHRSGVRAYDWALSLPVSGMPHLVGLALHGLVPVLFLGILRSMPLAGIHAAEHKVVHAIERGERLTPDVVMRMPRVHPRCGTNIAAGAALFLSLNSINFGSDWAELGLLGSLLLTLMFWRPLGHVLQAVATTKPPTRRQVQQAILAGEQLLERTQRAGNPRAHLGARLLRSGLPQIIVGVIAVASLLQLLEMLFGLSIPIVS